MKLHISLWVGCMLLSAAGRTQSPPSADAILKEAYHQADKEKKNVFVRFHASWDGWCHKMDAAMNNDQLKNFTDHSVIRHLVVSESKGNENLENPGAQDLLKKYEGDGQDIPYWLIFDKKGEKKIQEK